MAALIAVACSALTSLVRLPENEPTLENSPASRQEQLERLVSASTDARNGTIGGLVRDVEGALGGGDEVVQHLRGGIGRIAVTHDDDHRIDVAV